MARPSSNPDREPTRYSTWVNGAWVTRYAYPGESHWEAWSTIKTLATARI